MIPGECKTEAGKGLDKRGLKSSQNAIERTTMKKNNLVVLSVVVAALAVGSRVEAGESPTVDSILARYVKEMGGKTALEKVTSRVLKIKLESEAMGTGDGEIYAKAPNKQWSRIELPGVGTMNEGFDGKVAWAKNPWEGLRIKTGEELAKIKRDAEFHRELTCKKIYPDLAYKGTAKVDEEEADVLESKPSASSREKFFFSRKTGLLVRQESEFEGPPGRVTLVLQPREYKTLDGLKYPTQLKLKGSAGEQSFEFKIRIVEAKHNVEIEDAKFAKPEA